ncbi:MAG: hypothetical protein PHD72_01770 [Patescibacteria group bacterium]|nr:hypothetical protein [Patescibacteria group bacterium]
MSNREKNNAKEMDEMRAIMGRKQPGLSVEVRTRSNDSKRGIAYLVGAILLAIAFAAYVYVSRSSATPTSETTATSAE